MNKFTKDDFAYILLVTYIAGFIVYAILGFAGSFSNCEINLVIYGKTKIGHEENIKNTVLEYYSYDSP